MDNLSPASGWHELTLRSLVRHVSNSRECPSDSRIYASHRALGYPSDCSFYCGTEEQAGHREVWVGKPDLVCVRDEVVVLVGEVEQSDEPKKLLGDVLAVRSSTWATVADSDGRRQKARVGDEVRLILVLRKDKMAAAGSSKASGICNMIAQLSTTGIIKPVEVWLADGQTGTIETRPLFSSDRRAGD